MMQLVFCDQGFSRENFYPLSLNRPLADLRMGIYTFAERWSKIFKCVYSFQTVSYLSPVYQGYFQAEELPNPGFRPKKAVNIQGDSTEINLNTVVLVFYGLFLPSEELIHEINSLKINEAIYFDEYCGVLKLSMVAFQALTDQEVDDELDNLYAKGMVKIKDRELNPIVITRPEALLQHNGEAIRFDFDILTRNRISQVLNDTNRIKGRDIFIEEGVQVDFATFNTETGPIYIGKNTHIQEGVVIRGPFAVGESSQVKLGAHIHSHVSAGPFCRLGGEMNTSILWGYSNKGHFGYMGNSILGAGCNWGAGTSNSNMKNSFGNVRLFVNRQDQTRDTGLKYFGVIMGDYTKTAIHTAINSGSIIGIGCHLMSSEMIPKYLPNFTWMKGNQAYEAYQLDALISTLDLYFKHLGYEWESQKEEGVLREIKALDK